MKIIIIGCGKIGFRLAGTLAKMHDVTIIDTNLKKLNRVMEACDVRCVKGSGVSAAVLSEAGVKKADLVIATTYTDETNIVCCLTAKKLGASNVVARIRNPEYASELSHLKIALGLDLIINPQETVAIEIAKLMRFPTIENLRLFAKGHLEMIEISITDKMPIANLSVTQASKRFNQHFLIGAVRRGEKTIIPNGNTLIEPGDVIYVLGKPVEVTELCRHLGLPVTTVKSAVIVGGGRTAFYLANHLEEMDIKIKIIESDYERCLELSSLLPQAIIIHGDGTNSDLLLRENYAKTDAFISLTGKDESNFMAALLAKHNGIPHVLAKINNANYNTLLGDVGIEHFVNVSAATAKIVCRFIKSIENQEEGDASSFYRIFSEKATVLEFIVDDEHAEIVNIPLKKLPFKKGLLLAAIYHHGNLIIPNGNDIIKKGDIVVFIAEQNQYINLMENLLTTGE